MGQPLTWWSDVIGLEPIGIKFGQLNLFYVVDVPVCGLHM